MHETKLPQPIPTSHPIQGRNVWSKSDADLNPLDGLDIDGRN